MTRLFTLAIVIGLGIALLGWWAMSDSENQSEKSQVTLGDRAAKACGKGWDVWDWHPGDQDPKHHISVICSKKQSDILNNPIVKYVDIRRHLDS